MFPELVQKRERLKRRFARSLPHYARAARVQEEMARCLLEALRGFSCERILEIGVGAGLFTRKFRPLHPEAFYLALDLVSACAEYLRPLKVHFLVADAEDLDWLRASFDLIVSNATFQWFSRPEKALETYRRLLPPGGILAFTTFGPQTMRELSFHETPLRSFAYWQGLRNGFRPLVERCWTRRLFFSEPLEALRHVKETGALGSLPACWSLKGLRTVFEQIRSFREPRGFPLTYEPMLFVWEKE